MMKYADVKKKDLVTQAATYAANDCVGGLWSLEGCYNNHQCVAILNSVVARKKSAVATSLTLFIFDEEPTTSTFTENGPLDIADADVGKVIGIVTMANHVTLTSSSITYLNNIGQELKGKRNGAAELWFALRVDAETTFATTSDISLLLGLLKE